MGVEWRKARRAHHGRPDVIVGKKGLTREVLREIDLRLKNKGIVKVKVLKTGLESEGIDRRELAKRVAEALHAKLMGVRGRTFVLYRRPEGENLNRGKAER